MALFREDQGALKCRFLGENLWLLPWGKNALRVVSRPMSEPELPAWALLDPEKTESDIEISEREASIAVGKIKAVVRRMDWPDRLEITYYNQKGRRIACRAPRHRRTEHSAPLLQAHRRRRLQAHRGL